MLMCSEVNAMGVHVLFEQVVAHDGAAHAQHQDTTTCHGAMRCTVQFMCASLTHNSLYR
jgi:hypothetical protein